MIDKPTAILIGNLADDPELRFTNGGTPVCSFRMACNAWRGKDKEAATTFWDVTVWDKQGEHVAEAMSKGQRVTVIGELTRRSYENRDGQTVWVTEVKADEVSTSHKFGPNDSKPAGARAAAPQPPADDDVPF